MVARSSDLLTKFKASLGLHVWLSRHSMSMHPAQQAWIFSYLIPSGDLLHYEASPKQSEAERCTFHFVFHLPCTISFLKVSVCQGQSNCGVRITTWSRSQDSKESSASSDEVNRPSLGADGAGSLWICWLLSGTLFFQSHASTKNQPPSSQRDM